MELEDDVIVLVVASDESMLNKVSIESEKVDWSMLYKSDENQKMMDYIQTMDKHGQNIDVEGSLAAYYCEYLEDEMPTEINQRNDPIYFNIPDIGNETSIPNNEKHQNNSHCDREFGESWESLTFVKQLRQEYEELVENGDLLANPLEQVTEIVENPPLPKDFYVVNGIMSNVSSLYKHEKRCTAPDAGVELKTRAAYLSRKRGSHSSRLLRNEHRYPCTQCSAVFKTQRNLECHGNLHRGERPYRCQACPNAYTSRAGLYCHMKKHSNEQFICEYCGRSFKSKAILVVHTDRHRPLRKYACLECERRFAQKMALQLHVDRVHRNLPPPCACHLCPKRYPRMSVLKDHMKKAHDTTLITRTMFLKSLPKMTDMEVASYSLLWDSVSEVSEYEPDCIEIDQQHILRY